MVQTPAVSPAGNVIQISQYEALVGIIVFLVGIGISWGTITTKINQISEAIKNKIEPDLKDIRERFAEFEGKSAKLFASSSPISLLDKGNEVLIKSGFKKYIEDNKDSLLKLFGQLCNMDNPYDIQEQAFKFFDDLDLKGFDSELKKVSFEYGMNMSIIRRIGAIYFRDIVLKKAGFKPQDLDGKIPNA